MKTDREIAARIDEIDLEPIKFKFLKEYNCTMKDVETLEKWYRRFLFLTFKYKDRPIVVSEAIDNFWHQHILDTRKYSNDCEFAFGEFLHHFPYFGLRGEDDFRDLRTAYESTLELMRAEFGETPNDELRVLGTTKEDAVLPSLCSDCSGGAPSASYGFERPRFAGMAI